MHSSFDAVFVPGRLFAADGAEVLVSHLVGEHSDGSCGSEVDGKPAAEIVADWGSGRTLRFSHGEYDVHCLGLLRVQAAGTCCGIRFLFLAQGGTWAFRTQDEGGRPTLAGDRRPFVRRGYYGNGIPGVMTAAWAACVIHRCLIELHHGHAAPDAASACGG